MLVHEWDRHGPQPGLIGAGHRHSALVFTAAPWGGGMPWPRHMCHDWGNPWGKLQSAAGPRSCTHAPLHRVYARSHMVPPPPDPLFRAASGPCPECTTGHSTSEPQRSCRGRHPNTRKAPAPTTFLPLASEHATGLACTLLLCCWVLGPPTLSLMPCCTHGPMVVGTQPHAFNKEGTQAKRHGMTQNDTATPCACGLQLPRSATEAAAAEKQNGRPLPHKNHW